MKIEIPPGRQQSLFVQMLYDTQLYEQTKQFAGVLAKSQFVPKHFQGKAEDCFIGCVLAVRLNMDPIMVLQNTPEVLITMLTADGGMCRAGTEGSAGAPEPNDVQPFPPVQPLPPGLNSWMTAP